jgi:putative ABC transport system substrate-binding protein
LIRRRILFAIAFGLAVSASISGRYTAHAADSQQRVLRVGFVGPNSPSTDPRALTAFRDRLRELGWIEGQNLVIEMRWADGHADRLPGLVAEVIELKVDVIVTYSTPAAIAVKNATSTIPIVVAAMGDPVGTGLVTGLARPGGNLTGLSLGWGGGIGGKLLELLQETVPRLTTVAVLTNPDNPVERLWTAELKAAAPTRRLKLWIIDVRGSEALDGAFQQARRKAQAIVVIPGYLFMAQRQRIAALAAKHRLPAMYGLREFPDVGGLMAYGPDRAVMFRRAADYVDKILKGAKPGDLPVEQPTQYALVVNLKTAKALGLTIPESILVRADEVIR